MKTLNDLLDIEYIEKELMTIKKDFFIPWFLAMSDITDARDPEHYMDLYMKLKDIEKTFLESLPKIPEVSINPYGMDVENIGWNIDYMYSKWEHDASKDLPPLLTVSYKPKNVPVSRYTARPKNVILL